MGPTKRRQSKHKPSSDELHIMPRWNTNPRTSKRTLLLNKTTEGGRQMFQKTWRYLKHLLFNHHSSTKSPLTSCRSYLPESRLPTQTIDTRPFHLSHRSSVYLLCTRQDPIIFIIDITYERLLIIMHVLVTFPPRLCVPKVSIFLPCQDTGSDRFRGFLDHIHVWMI